MNIEWETEAPIPASFLPVAWASDLKEYRKVMAEFDSKKIEYGLRIEGDYYNHLDIEGFSLMMKNP